MTKVNSYFKWKHYPARRRAFELPSKMPKVEAVKLIALESTARLGDIVIKEVSTCDTQNLSPEKSVLLIKAWLGSILPKKEAEWEAIAKVIREFDPAAVSDTPMLEHDNKINQTISSQDFTAEKKRLLKTALRLRPEIWLLNDHWGFVSPQSGLIHVHCPPWNLITDIFYSSIPSMNSHAITDEHLNHASLPCAPNLRKRKDFEALLDSLRIEGDNGSWRRFEALRN